MASEQRHFNNHLPMGTPVDAEALQQIPKAAAAALKKIKVAASAHQDITGGSIYVGSGGIALLYLKMADMARAGVKFSVPYLSKHTPSHCQELAGRFASDAEAIMPTKKRVTFLEGYSGLLALQAALAQADGDPLKASEKAEALERYHGEAVSKLAPGECELLYGRAGYLWALLWTEGRLGQGTISKQLIKALVSHLLEEGEATAARAAADSGGSVKYGLLYSWHDKLYLGAAHGLCGVLMVLLHCLPTVAEVDPSGAGYKAVRAACDALVTALGTGGNLPSRPGAESDRLVQWCHGAPGLVPLLVRAHASLCDDGRYLQAAHKAAAAVWERGLLKKGVGLCHGIAGNAYGFLSLYRATRDARYLSCAQQYAAYMAGHWEELYDTPDRPASLFEGLAGAVCLWLDVLAPEQSRFPGYEL